MTVRTWTCQRQSGGVPCKHVNPRKLQICASCGKRRAAITSSRDVPKVPYEECVRLFGEVCGMCGQPPKPGKKLNRDHDHASNELRGLLCFQCNFRLRSYASWKFIQSAYHYLWRHERRMGRLP